MKEGIYPLLSRYSFDTKCL